MTAPSIRAVPKRVRLDQLLVERGLAPSRERAQALILAGVVRVDGARADRAAAPVRDGSGRDCLDVGASTGGFTDVLLQRGAARVHAVDVGKGQLDWKLRSDPRVALHEGVNAREGIPVVERVDLVVADVSFISLRLVLPPALALLRDGGDVVALVKPQFEAGRGAVGGGGLVRDPVARADAVLAVARDLAMRGAPVVAVAPSSPAGREGNREIFVHARKGGRGLDDAALAEAARAAAG
ncbi:MAG: TlyA family rRNA (cytidine-2'-O)-methyltransferase [Chloroflexi bacterium]|nr:MAG: TlyA family rRNA (cytidine-2'-O)-methyltransferase [Chloroflexota bacterium]